MDTSARAQVRYFELLAKQTPEQRFAAARRLTTMVRQLALAGIRQANPESSEREVRIELVRRLYGDAVATRLSPRLRHG